MDLIATLDNVLRQLGLGVDVTHFLAIFGLAMARLLGAFVLNPFLGGTVVPARVKIGLAVIVTAILLPSISPGTENVQLGSVTTFALLMKEMLIGVTIGLISQFIFYAVQMSGTLIDTQRGMNQATFFSPQLPGNVSVLGQLKFQAALALFLTVNGHLLFLSALAGSFQNLRVSEFPQFQAGIPAMVDQIVRISAATLVVAVQLSAPILLVLFLVDVAFGAISKIAPQINAHQESQTVKAFLGLILILLTIGLIMSRIGDQFAQMIQDISNVVRLFI